jgi:hypothetical protein
MTSPDVDHWRQAMAEEYHSLIKNHTWTLTPLPLQRSAVECKWTYKHKYHTDDTIARYKARLVAKGYSQQPGIDFTETYSPVVCSDSIRAVLSIIAVNDLELRQFDITTAFLNGSLREEIFMRQPVGFIDPDHPHSICHLHKSIYGLRQASRVWNTMFADSLKRNKLQPTTKDPCVYVSQDSPRVNLLIFVDDGLICCSDASHIDNILQQMNSVFHMKDDDLDIYLGLRIHRDRINRTLFLDQHLYIERQILKYGFADAKPINIPADPNLILSWHMDPDTHKNDNFPFQEAIGSLNFAQTCTHPNISYALSAAGQFA